MALYKFRIIIISSIITLNSDFCNFCYEFDVSIHMSFSAIRKCVVTF